MRDFRHCLKEQESQAGKAMWNSESYTERIFQSPNIVNLCVDFYNGEEQRGSLYHRYTADAVSFSSLLDAMEQMDQLYDRLQFPRAATRLRSFCKSRGGQKPAANSSDRNSERSEGGGEKVREMESFDEVVEHRGKDATFLIRVKHRQNSSWQGEVTWVDGQKKENFRSALELIRLIDSAMGAADD